MSGSSSTIGSPLVPDTAVGGPPPPGGTRLITSASDRQTLTLVQETDCRTALTRGLREYLEQLSIEWVTRARIRFAKVYETWAVPEAPATYPSAVVWSPEDGAYDFEERLTPSVLQVPGAAPGQALADHGEFVLKMYVDVWASDPAEREALCAMLEDAFSPTTFMTGFRLELPHFHGARSTWELVSSRYVDDAESAQQRRRQAQFALVGKAPYLRAAGRLPLLSTRTSLDAGLRDVGSYPGSTPSGVVKP